MKKSILFVNGHLQIGGVEKALVDLLSWIDYDRYDVDLLLLEGEGDYRDLVPDQVRVIHKDLRQIEGPFWKNLWKNFRSCKFGNVLYRIINSAAKKDKECLRFARPLLPVRKYYDVAIAFRHGHPAEIVAYSLDADLKICWWHHGSVPDSFYQIKELTSLFSCFDKVVTVSEGCKNLLVASFSLEPAKVSVIPNIIDSERINTLAKGIDPYGNDNRYRIVTLSRFAPEKHLEEAVEAASLLVGKLDFVWYMIGDGTEFEMVKERVLELGLADRIVLPGSLANPYPYLKFADLMVHPSHVESLCISVLEAMSLNLLCVVVRSIGPESYIEDGVIGILTECGVASLYDGVSVISSLNNSVKNRIKQAARMMVDNLFSPVIVIKKFEALISGD